jgi:hypothetical protein
VTTAPAASGDRLSSSEVAASEDSSSSSLDSLDVDSDDELLAELVEGVIGATGVGGVTTPLPFGCVGWAAGMGNRRDFLALAFGCGCSSSSSGLS